MKPKFKVQRKRKAVRKTRKSYSKPLMYKIVKPEKKYFDYIPVMKDGEGATLPNIIGQVNGIQDGVYVADITPYPAQGTLNGQRLGQVIDLSSLVFRAQFISQEDLKTSLNFNIMILCRKDAQQLPLGGATTTAGEIFDVNNYNGLYDINTLRDPNQFPNYRAVYNKTHYIPADQFSTQGDRLKDVRINLKANKRIRYRDEFNQYAVENQFILVIRCNTGNCSAVDVSTNANVALVAVNTGARMLMSIRATFTDS